MTKLRGAAGRKGGAATKPDDSPEDLGDDLAEMEARSPPSKDTCIISWRYIYSTKQLRKAARHNKREIPQELRPGGRIDVDRIGLNESLLQTLTAADVVELHEATVRGVPQWGAGGDRAQAVAIEVMLTPHPDAKFDRPALYRDMIGWFGSVLGGPQNAMSADVHRDESVEHMQAIFAPVRTVTKRGKPTKSLSVRDIMNNTGRDEAMKNAFEREVLAKYGLRRPTVLTDDQHKSGVAALLQGIESAQPETVLARVMPVLLGAIRDNMSAFVRAIGGDVDALIADPPGETARLFGAAKIEAQPQFTMPSTDAQIEAEPQLHGQGGEHALTPPEANCHPCVGNFTSRGEPGAFAVGEAVDSRAPDPLAKPHTRAEFNVDPETGELIDVGGAATAPGTTSASQAADTQVQVADDARRISRQRTNAGNTTKARAEKLQRRHPRPAMPTFAETPARLRKLAGEGDVDARTVMAAEFALIDLAGGAMQKAHGQPLTSKERERATLATRVAMSDWRRGLPIDWPRITADLAMPGMELIRPLGERLMAQGAVPSATPTKASHRPILARRRASAATAVGASPA